MVVDRPKKNSEVIIEALDDMSGAVDDMVKRMETIERGMVTLTALVDDIVNRLVQLQDQSTVNFQDMGVLKVQASRIDDTILDMQSQVQTLVQEQEKISKSMPDLDETIDALRRNELNDMRLGARAAMGQLRVKVVS